MTIQFRPEQEQIIDQAIQAGLIDRADQVVDLGLETLRSRLQTLLASGGSMNAEEWMSKFRAWAHSHPTTTPLLSDEAVSRDFIYQERGL